MIETIAFDADDTLWHNEMLFSEAEQLFHEILADYADAETTRSKMREIEHKNIKLFGYGVKGFTLSLVETAIELTEGHIDAAGIHRIIGIGKSMLTAPVLLLDGVRQTLEALHGQYELLVITKGDLKHQQEKLKASALGRYFSRVEILAEKDPDAYQDIVIRHGITPERFMMIGNSLKSDVLPVLAIGGHAVHIPYHTLSYLEHVEETDIASPRFHLLESITNLPGLLRQLQNKAAR